MPRETNDRVAITVHGRSLAGCPEPKRGVSSYFRDDTRVFLIWVNGIRIGQNSDEGRAFQVQQMGEVYKATIHTLILLLLATEASDLDFKMLEFCPDFANFTVALSSKMNAKLLEYLSTDMDLEFAHFKIVGACLVDGNTWDGTRNIFDSISETGDHID